MAATSGKAAGLRDTPVVVQRLKPTAVPGPGGHIDESDDANWETATDIGGHGMLWAAVAARSTREFVRGDQVVGDVTHQVEVDYGSARGIGEKMRFLIGGTRRLNINGPPINVGEANHTLRCLCVEV